MALDEFPTVWEEMLSGKTGKRHFLPGAEFLTIHGPAH